MEQKQLEVIVGLMAGMQLAIVHVCKTLENKGLASSEELAKSFELTGAAVPEGTHQRQLLQMVLGQIAVGIRSAAPKDDSDRFREALH